MSMTVGELVAPARRGMILSACLTGLGGLCSLVPYVALTIIAGLWLDQGYTPAMWWWLVAGIVGTAAHIVLYGIGLKVSHIVEAQLRHQLRRRVVDTLGRIPLGRLDHTSSGAVRKLVVDDTTAIHTLVAHLSGDAAGSVVTIVGSVAVLLWADWLLTLALLGVWLAIFLIVIASTMRGYGDSVKEFSKAQSDLSAATVEMTEGIKEIKNFHATDTARTRFDETRRAFAEISFAWMRRSGMSVAIFTSFLKPGVVLATLTPLAVLFVAQGWTPIDRTLPFFLIAIGIPAGLGTLASLLQHLYEAQQAAKSTAGILSLEPIAEGTSRGTSPGTIAFDNVTFGYDPEHPVLRGVSFTAAPGTVTALVGPSGGGKTTIARLIARFYDADQGSVQVGGADVRDVPQEWLLQQLAIVFQDIALAHDTVAANIRLGRPEATHDEVVAAAQAALIHDRIMRLPQGYDTIIGDEDGFLSGGEQQRITIARAYLRDAPILVLDEATASTDPQAEHQIHEALTRLSQGRTVIVIAHRLATITDADNIIVVADGGIVEQGTHDDLLTLGGRYASLWSRQHDSEAA